MSVYTITVQRTISMGHRLPSYEGICSSPHGHNVTIEVEVMPLQGEFLDFKVVDTLLWGVIADFDHAMVLYGLDPLVKLFRKEFPQFRLVTLNVEPSTENIAQYIFDQIHSAYGTVRVTVYETAKYSATVAAYGNDRVHRT